MPRKLTVRLDPEEVQEAKDAAAADIAYATSMGFLMGHHSEDPERRWRINVLGHKAEIAAGRTLDLLWKPTPGAIDQPDLGVPPLIVEVRACISAQDPHLTIRGRDVTKFEAGKKQDCPWVAVQGVWVPDAPVLHIQGWLPFSHALDLRGREVRPGEWHIPTASLLDIRTLIEEVATWHDRARYEAPKVPA